MAIEGKNAKVVSFINLKGGVGKTTICLTIGEILAFSMNKEVLLIDLDSQSNLSSAIVSEDILRDYKKKKASIYHLFSNLLNPDKAKYQWNINNAIVRECSNIRDNSNLSAILSLPELGQFDEDLADALERGGKGASSSIKITLEWRKILNNYLPLIRHKYDYILIDCPPSLSLFTSNALIASDYFVTPIVPEYLSLQGLTLIQERLGRLKQRTGLSGMKVNFAGCIINRVDIRRKDHIKLCNENIHKHPGKFFPFKYWIGDLKPMYIVTDYNYPFNEKNRKWESVREKYNYEDRDFRNPKGTALYIPEESNSYSLYDMLYKLCNEFIGRCK